MNAPRTHSATPQVEAPVLPFGPRALDASELAQVSGGAPRGGWLAALTTTSEQATIEVEAPRGGW